MAGYILCQTPVAREAYFIENIQMNIYSLEELCYYLRRNLYLVDETLMGEELAYWISNELKLPGLGAKIRARLGKKTGAGTGKELGAGKTPGIEEFLFPIFKEINYLPYEELKLLSQEILTYQNQSPKTRLLCKAKAFLRNGMYMKAMGIYQKLLAEDALYGGGEEKVYPDFLCPIPEVSLPEAAALEEGKEAAVYLSGLGLCSARLFQMEKSCEYFWQAYKLSGEEQYLEKSLLALRAASGEEVFLQKLEELQVPEETKAALREKLSGLKDRSSWKVEKEQADGYLDQFMKQYHRSMTP